MKTTKVGIIGCGMISDTYFNAAKKFPILEVVACSDIIPERSAAKFEKHGVKNVTNEEIFANPEIEIVINLTPPQVHSKIAIDTLNAGKHAYSEKPFGVDFDDAAKVIALAKEKGLRVGCAPDTYLGGGQQTARKMIDDGWIGKPLSGTAIVAGRGPEKWGQAPFFYDYGAGPMLDLGPYYCIYGVDNLDGLSKLDRARELLRLITESCKVSADEVVLIGDSLHDKEVSDSLGVRCVLCSQGSHSFRRLAEVAPTGNTLMEAVRLAYGCAWP